jgi:hypothetical protein
MHRVTDFLRGFLPAQVSLVPFFRSVSRDGCTRLGSPGIFGLPPCYRPCSPGCLQVAGPCHAGSCRASTRRFSRPNLQQRDNRLVLPKSPRPAVVWQAGPLAERK